MSEPSKTFAEASSKCDARDRDDKVILFLIVAPIVVYFVTWIAGRFF